MAETETYVFYPPVEVTPRRRRLLPSQMEAPPTAPTVGGIPMGPRFYGVMIATEFPIRPRLWLAARLAVAVAGGQAPRSMQQFRLRRTA